MKKTLFAISAFLMLTFGASADEGMWLLPLLQKMNGKAMANIGCRLTPEQIYDINHSSLKDAIVQFGGGCTGEMISDKGLLVTNHHCGYGSIWPMSIILKGLTTDDPNEVDACLDLLQRTDADTGLMHESFDKDDAKKFTRAWFAWANTLFGELVLRRLERSVMHCRPDAQEGRRLKGEKR